MDVLTVAMIMAQKTSTNGDASTSHELKPIFHDFLGMGCAADGTVAPPLKAVLSSVADPRQSEASPSASASVEISSGGGPAPIFNNSDLSSVEKQTGHHLEGVPFYGPRDDFSGPGINDRFTRAKRSCSDSAFVVSFGDEFPRIGSDTTESLHLMKMPKNGLGGERSRQFADDGLLLNMQLRRQKTASLAMHTNVSKLDQSVPLNMGPMGLHMGQQFMPILTQISSNNAGPSIISQSAADEGSRTGLKGPEIFGSINACGGASERIPSTAPASCRRSNPGSHISEPDTSSPLGGSRCGSTSLGQQMTVFYGGQAHVFDDVHPSKADKIMSLAGSNGGSWSALCSPMHMTTPKHGMESCVPSDDNKRATICNVAPSP